MTNDNKVAVYAGGLCHTITNDASEYEANEMLTHVERFLILSKIYDADIVWSKGGNSVKTRIIKKGLVVETINWRDVEKQRRKNNNSTGRW